MLLNMQNDQEGIVDIKNTKTTRINTVTELIRFCFKSKSFCRWFKLLLGYFTFSLIVIPLCFSSSGPNSVMSLLFIIPVWILTSLIFTVAVIFNMGYATEGIEKSFSSRILFAVIATFIPIPIAMFVLLVLSILHIS